MAEYTVVSEFYEGPLDEDRLLLHMTADDVSEAIENAQKAAILHLQRGFPEYMQRINEKEDDASPPLKIWAVFEGHLKDLSDRL